MKIFIVLLLLVLLFVLIKTAKRKHVDLRKRRNKILRRLRREDDTRE